MRQPLSPSGLADTPQAPGRTPQLRCGAPAPRLRWPGGHPRTPEPPEASEAPAREAM
jgi:hypothetical protein